MASRRPFVGGNWKMNLDGARAVALGEAVARGVRDVPGVDVAIFPPFPYLMVVGRALRGLDSGVLLGAQDCFHEPDGAYTGEVSIAMLRDCGVGVVLTGHSERRHVIGESDDLVGAKTRAVLAAGLECVLCVGERLEEREAGQADRVNERQVRAGLSGVAPEQVRLLTIAYEPVWAIGTGRTASPEDAQRAQARIRGVLGDLFGADAASGVRIQYGGSVKPTNAAGLFARMDVDGALVGGASLDAGDMLAIVRAAAQVGSGTTRAGA